jgi:hypothetical protein
MRGCDQRTSFLVGDDFRLAFLQIEPLEYPSCFNIG